MVILSWKKFKQKMSQLEDFVPIIGVVEED
jgi:hypothetical protein